MYFKEHTSLLSMKIDVDLRYRRDEANVWPCTQESGPSRKLSKVRRGIATGESESPEAYCDTRRGEVAEPGLRRTPGTRVDSKGSRAFKSLPLRQPCRRAVGAKPHFAFLLDGTADLLNGDLSPSCGVIDLESAARNRVSSQRSYGLLDCRSGTAVEKPSL